MDDLIPIAIDWETYYSPTYSLRKMTTTEYIMHAEFEVIGLGLCTGAQQPAWCVNPADILDKIDWSRVLLIAHNAMFDGAILEWKFGKRPAKYMCTMMGVRPYVTPYTGRADLRTALSFLSLGEKGDEVHSFGGYHRADFSPDELRRYGEYCKNDARGALNIYRWLSTRLPPEELDLIDLTIKKFVRPQLALDPQVIDQRLASITAEKKALIHNLANQWSITATQIRSRPQFSQLLESRGVRTPTKISPSTGVETMAMSKQDAAFLELLGHPDPVVRTLVKARFMLASNMEETRLQRLRSLAALNFKGAHMLPVPLLYYGAHPGRFSGLDKINLQNAPRPRYLVDGSIDPASGSIRRAIVAPPGYTIISADLAQIEARIVATLAKCWALVETFRSGDPYAAFATRIYGRPITKKQNPDERFVGKTCLAGDTPILCECGWKRLDTVSKEDRVWDGVEWVCHQGVVNNGEKEIIDFCGVSSTPDHQILCESQWREAGSLEQDTVGRSLALVTGAGSLLSQASFEAPDAAWPRFLCDAIAGVRNTWSAVTTSSLSNPHAAQRVRDQLHGKNGIGNTLKQCRRLLTVQGCSTDFRQQLLAATHQLAVCLLHMEAAASALRRRGELTEQNFCDISVLCRDGITQLWKWIAKTTRAGTSVATFGSSQDASKYQIDALSGRCKQKLIVYDLLSSGSRHRFTILTDQGPVIAHNCILGLGYGMGYVKFQNQMLLAGRTMKSEETYRIVQLYRDTYSEIASLWGILDNLIAQAQSPRCMVPFGPVVFMHERIVLPNGMPIIYPGLRRSRDGLVFRNRRSTEGEVTVWGGKVLENIVQALARIIVTRAELRLAKAGLYAALQVHDELVFCVPDNMVERAMQATRLALEAPVDFLPRLPVSVEIHAGSTYLDCK